MKDLISLSPQTHTEEPKIEFEDRWPGCLEDERPPNRWLCSITDNGITLWGIGFTKIDALIEAAKAHEKNQYEIQSRLVASQTKS